MKIQYASDLHLEFPENTLYMERNPLIPLGDILLLAGDISVLNEDYDRHPFWDWASKHFEQTLVICGNHEFYDGYDIGELSPGCIRKIRPNVKLYHNAVVTIGDVDFVLTTLWGIIPWDEAHLIQQRISDFMRIKRNGQPYLALDFNELYYGAVQFLKDAVSQSEKKKVVVTHHVPTMLCCDPRFKSSPLNRYFVTEMFDFIFDHPIDYWVYGHSHANIPETDVNGTKLLCNQLGYIESGREPDFNRTVVFEI